MRNPFTNTECTKQAIIFNRFWNNELVITPSTIEEAFRKIENFNSIEMETWRNYIPRFKAEYRDLKQSNMTSAWSTAIDNKEIEALRTLSGILFPSSRKV